VEFSAIEDSACTTSWCVWPRQEWYRPTRIWC